MNSVEKLEAPLPDEVLDKIRESISTLRKEYTTRRFDFFPYEGEGYTVLYRCDRGSKKWCEELAKIPIFADPEWTQHYTGRFDASGEIYQTFLQEMNDVARDIIDFYVDEGVCWSIEQIVNGEHLSDDLTYEHYEFIEYELAPQTVQALLKEAG